MSYNLELETWELRLVEDRIVCLSHRIEDLDLRDKCSLEEYTMSIAELEILKLRMKKSEEVRRLKKRFINQED